MAETPVTRKQLIEKLNEDLSREYQAIIAYVVYSQVLKGAEYMNIAEELKLHAAQELPPPSQFSRCWNVFLKEREDFPGKRLPMLARPVPQSLIEVIGNIFDV